MRSPPTTHAIWQKGPPWLFIAKQQKVKKAKREKNRPTPNFAANRNLIPISFLKDIFSPFFLLFISRSSMRQFLTFISHWHVFEIASLVHARGRSEGIFCVSNFVLNNIVFFLGVCVSSLVVHPQNVKVMDRSIAGSKNALLQFLLLFSSDLIRKISKRT